MKNINDELKNKNLIDDSQFQFLEAIRTDKIISIFYELRGMLYLGILLFTSGLGYIAYKNIGSIGHIVAILLIAVAIGFGFRFINKWSLPFAHNQVENEHSHYDYLVLLVGLLIIALFTYIQVYFDMVEQLLNGSSFLSAAVFVFMAYRYDNKALLALAITALAAGVGLSISPVNWVQGEWMDVENLMYTSQFFGLILIGIGQWSEYKFIKSHFRFTYQNFGLLLFFSGAIAAIFASSLAWLFVFLVVLTASFVLYYSWRLKEFLFFIYGSIAGYVAITYLIFNTLNRNEDGFYLLIYYIPISCIAYVTLLLRNKSHFAND